MIITISYFFAGILGICIGSFLNVVIYRLPLMLAHTWQYSCLCDLTKKPQTPPLTLATPASHCPHCQHPLRWRDNIPLLSFILLHGKCAFCQQKIAWHYPLIELLTFFTSIILCAHFGVTLTFAISLLFSCYLMVLTSIDLKYQLLPDRLTLSLLWLGLIVNTMGLFTPPSDAIMGAVVGYLGLWVIYWLYYIVRKNEGIGQGDVKLLAALGAWFGWQNLCLILFISSLLASITGLILLMTKRVTLKTAIAFGPYLAIAGWIILRWGDFLSALIFWRPHG